MKKDKNLTRKIALTGIMCALALALSYLETLIPAYPGFPPGAKPGLSNIVTMFMAGSSGTPYAFFITIIKGLFAGVTRGFTAMLMSLSGGILSTAAACLLFRFAKNKLGYIGISIVCAVCHNIGQLAAACIISGTASLVVGYGPLLLIFAVVTGLLTGAILKAVMPTLAKIAKIQN
ncbi:MAG: Gx transporter family protein [Clostridiaceae bacterium]|nr:Gx transporter family protein [Clostridiaceae bacterium]MDY5889202.1 Gx transporter family protein [Oscillospiraceae bacterium]